MLVAADITIDIKLIPDQPRQFAAFLLLAAMLLTFAFIRTSARLMRSPKVPWWPGSVKTGELHIHHLVFGIVLLLLAGFLEFALRPGEPWLDVFAIAFGIGAGLTLDEFALWLHLEDVYWSEEGRSSVDAVVIAALLGGAIVLGGSPLSKEDTTSVITIVVVLVVVILFCAIAALKGKIILAVAGIPIPFFGIVGAVRLAKPNSPWARRRYKPGSRKLARAQRRAGRHARRYRRMQELIGGAPTPTEAEPDPSPPPSAGGGPASST
jgi:hypothetical protein